MGPSVLLPEKLSYFTLDPKVFDKLLIILYNVLILIIFIHQPLYTSSSSKYREILFYFLQIPRHDKGIQWNLSIRRSNLNLGC